MQNILTCFLYLKDKMKEEINWEKQNSNFLFLPKLYKNMFLFLHRWILKIIIFKENKNNKIFLTLELLSKPDSTAVLACFM